MHSVFKYTQAFISSAHAYLLERYVSERMEKNKEN